MQLQIRCRSPIDLIGRNRERGPSRSAVGERKGIHLKVVIVDRLRIVRLERRPGKRSSPAEQQKQQPAKMLWPCPPMTSMHPYSSNSNLHIRNTPLDATCMIHSAGYTIAKMYFLRFTSRRTAKHHLLNKREASPIKFRSGHDRLHHPPSRIPKAPRERLLPPSQPLGRRLSPLSPQPRLQGPGHHQRRLCLLRGLPDADWAVPRDAVLEHIAEIVASVDLPVNADFQSGYAHEPEDVAENVRLCVETGVAGLSIEDATGDHEEPLYDLPLAVERIKAAKAAITASGADVLLVARAECYLVGHPDPLHESIRRLEAYAEAGADVLYAPGAAKRADIEAIVKAVHPKPVNILLTSSAGLKIPELAEIGVRRISVGSALARAAWTGFIHAAREMAQENSMAGLDDSVPLRRAGRLLPQRSRRAVIASLEGCQPPNHVISTE